MAENGMTVDVAGFKKQVNTFAQRWGLDAGMVMRDQMRLWAEDLVRNTPHKSATKARVNAAITRQLKRIFLNQHIFYYFLRITISFQVYGKERPLVIVKAVFNRRKLRQMPGILGTEFN